VLAVLWNMLAVLLHELLQYEAAGDQRDRKTERHRDSETEIRET